MTPALRLTCFGSLQIELDGKPLTRFETDKARALLVYLAVERERPHQRGHLAGLLWCDQPEERALHNLRQTLSYLRKTLADDRRTQPILLTERDTVQLNPAAEVWLDADAFRRALTAAYRHHQRQQGRGQVNFRRLRHALTLYNGQFLDQFHLTDGDLFDEWASLLREQFDRLAVEGFALLAEYHERRQEFALARRAAARITDLAPWEETAQAQLMRLYALDRQWSAAQNQFVTLRRYLADQLGVEPTAETAALFDQIRRAAAANTPIPLRFPPARHNLPPAATGFLGRADELDAIAEWIADPQCRLITLLGPGGIGKTRLALEAATEQVGAFPDGVFFIPLAATTDPGQLPLAISAALGFRFTERGEPLDQLLDYLRSKSLLLVLDNYEQLLSDSAGASLPAEIIRRAPAVTLLVTSRQRLNLHEEHTLPLEGLSYPAAAETAADPDAYAAPALFLQRLRQAQGSAPLTAETRSAVFEICRILDGLPLGVELAAAAAIHHPLAKITGRLHHSLDVLTASAANLPARHRSLSAAFDVSCQLLTADLRRLFARLSVFRGGFDLAAAAAICAAREADLASLQDQSLLRVAADGRYEMHEAIRQYAAGLLTADPAAAAETRARHAAYFAALLARAAPDLKGAAQEAALQQLHTEQQNILDAWEWLAANQRSVELAASADSLYHYYNIRSLFTAGMALFQRAADALTAPEHEWMRARLLARLGGLAYRARQNALASATLTESREILTRHGDESELAFCLIQLGGVKLRARDLAAARGHAADSLARFQALGDAWGQSYALYLLALIANRQGDMETARPLLEDAVRLSRQTGDQRRLIAPLNLLGDIACAAGDFEHAAALFAESLEISRRLGDRFNEGILLNNLASIHQHRNEYDREQQALEQSLAICREIGDREGEAMALNSLGEMKTHTGDYPEAVAFSEQALVIARELGDDWLLAVCLNNLGEAHTGLSQFQQAGGHLHAAIRLFQAGNNLDLLARAVINLGRAHQLQGDAATAADLLRAALANSATDAEERAKARQYLAGLCEDAAVAEDDAALEKIVEEILTPPESSRLS